MSINKSIIKIGENEEVREDAHEDAQAVSDSLAPARTTLQQVLQDWSPDGEPWETSPANIVARAEKTDGEDPSLVRSLVNLQRRLSQSPAHNQSERDTRSDTEPMEEPQSSVVNNNNGDAVTIDAPEQIVIDVFPQHFLLSKGEVGNLSVNNQITGSEVSYNPSQEMEVEMDNASVASSSAQVLGKRKKPDRDTDTDDPTPQIRRSSRTSKVPCVATDEETSSKRITRSTNAITRSTHINVNTDSEPQSQSCSEAEGRGARKPPKKPGKRRRSVDEPTIEQRLRPLPQDIEEFGIAPVSQIRASAIEWLDDIETIRANSSYQGYLSGQIRRRVKVIKEILRVFGEKIEDSGDPGYLRRRNTELAAELASSKRETAKLRRDVQDLQKIVGDLKKAVDGGRFTEKSEKATSPIEIPNKGSKSKSKSKERKDISESPSVNVANMQFTDVVMRPPLKGISVPIPAVERSTLKAYQDVDAELSRRIVELTSQRKELRQSLKDHGQNSAPGAVSAQAKQMVAANRPKIISNIQVVAPKGKVTQTLLETQPSESTVVNSQKDEAWQQVESKKDKRQRRKKTKQTVLDSQKTGTEKPKGANSGEAKRRRPPRTAAVAIRGVADGFSYAAALKKLREEISLSDLQIDKPSIRHSANGGIVIEVPGKDKALKAEALKEKVAGVLGETAIVTRPVVKGEVRLIGIDDSVVTDEVADVIASAGECRSEEVKVGIIRPMSNGLFTVWAQCPLAAAIKATQQGKIKIGWTVARIELLKARPTQCYKCWGHGHLRGKCTATVDRSRTCFRCGEMNHSALTCQNPVRCILCVEQGKDPNHRVGSNQCKADFKTKPVAGLEKSPDRRPVAMEIEDETESPPM